MKDTNAFKGCGMPLACEEGQKKNGFFKVLQMRTNQENAIADVLEERERQEAKWGEQNHDPFTYLAILTEEVGEYAQACLDTRFGGKDAGYDKMLTEIIQTTAVALAMLECLDRDK